ncbi:MAG: TIGR03905 family TSCPD domain-containing protein [Syntrophobacteraceae bacterium]|jgi:uncharacterized protein (TIGR03905 family)
MYVFKPKGICPAEIHFTLKDNSIRDLRVVGGGCHGNSQLIARLLDGIDVDKVLPFLHGIVCRNDTSCADQLAKALLMAKNGEINEADPVTIGIEEAGELRKLAVIAEVRGDLDGIERVHELVKAEGVQVLYSLGNLVGGGHWDDSVVEMAAREKIRSVQGPLDHMIALGVQPPMADVEQGAWHAVRQTTRDRLLLNPLIRTFNLCDRHGVAFHGGFIQDLPGFSDFGPYAAEILAVCNLSDYLRDESVFPALESMMEHFTAGIVLFGQAGEWKHVRLGGVDLISVGALRSLGFYRYALIEWKDGNLDVQFTSAPIENKQEGARR